MSIGGGKKLREKQKSIFFLRCDHTGSSSESQHTEDKVETLYTMRVAHLFGRIRILPPDRLSFPPTPAPATLANMMAVVFAKHINPSLWLVVSLVQIYAASNVFLALLSKTLFSISTHCQLGK